MNVTTYRLFWKKVHVWWDKVFLSPPNIWFVAQFPVLITHIFQMNRSFWFKMKIISSNIIYSFNILRACKKNNIKNKLDFKQLMVNDRYFKAYYIYGIISYLYFAVCILLLKKKTINFIICKVEEENLFAKEIFFSFNWQYYPLDLKMKPPLNKSISVPFNMFFAYCDSCWYSDNWCGTHLPSFRIFPIAWKYLEICYSVHI